MRAILILVLVMGTCFVQGRLPKCTDCAGSTSPCDQVINLIKDNCTCSNCITRCSVRYDRCTAGEQCIEVPSNFSEKVLVAKCVPFTACPELSCSLECPVSGFFIDNNDCKTCLCNDPCAELQCQNECIMSSSSSFLEPNVECDEAN